MDYKQRKNEVEVLDNRAIKKMLKRSRGIGRLALELQRLDRSMDLIMYQIYGQSLKYDLYLEQVLGDELRDAF